MKKLLTAAFLLFATSAFAQSVQQSGTVTRGHVPYWVTSGVIGDGGSSADSPITSLGITNNGGQGLCVNSARQSSAGYNALCLGASTTGPATISLQNFGTAPAEGIQFIINGVTQGFPTVTGAPVTVNDIATFSTTAGSLKDSAIATTNNGGIVLNPTPLSLSQGFTVTQSGSGSTLSNAQQYFNFINITSDVSNTGSSTATSYSIGQLINYAYGGAAKAGGVEGLFVATTQTAATSNGNAVRFYTAIGGQAQANASDGGTIGGGNEKGKQYGSNFICALANGATGFEQCSAQYNQVFMLTGSSAKTKAIEQLVYGATDAVQGATNDAALLITAETGASAGGKNGILFTNSSGANPLSATGTVLAMAGSPTVAHGIDMSGATCSTDCFKSTGFNVDGSGNITGNNFGAYSQASFTPTLLGSSTAGSPTYTAQVGSYEKIGRQVTVRFTIATSALGSPTGNMEVGGLPFTSNATTNDNGVCVISNMAGVTLDASYTTLSGTIGQSATVMNFIENGSGQTGQAVPVAKFGATTTIVGICNYHT